MALVVQAGVDSLAVIGGLVHAGTQMSSWHLLRAHVQVPDRWGKLW